MSISKKIIVSLVVIGSVTQLLSLQSIQAQEANEPNVTNITANMPRNGWVEMDDNGKVVDTNLYDEMDDDTAIDSGYSGFRTAINYPFGRWVYYVDTFPFAPWGRKISHSNFNHYRFYHRSTAGVENGFWHTAYADANIYSYAQAEGPSDGTAYAFYNW